MALCLVNRCQDAVMCTLGKDFKDPAPGVAKVCMCSSAEWPDVPTTESFAEPASTKAKQAMHFYGNCNDGNKANYADKTPSKKDCCINRCAFFRSIGALHEGLLHTRAHCLPHANASERRCVRFGKEAGAVTRRA
jgi:hypothetical protein